MLDQRAATHRPLNADRPPKVLLVDDDPASRRLLQASIGADFEVWSAADGEEALALIESSPPDVLVLDLEMPGLNGAEVCRRLRASERVALNQLPVIMLTGHAGEAEEIGCLTAGANDFVTKPVGRAVLIARIETQLRLGALSDELRAQNEELARWREMQEADLAAARVTQQAVVAPIPPQIAGWKVETIYTPLIQVGGDVYGWRQLEDGRWIFWLADATGHGVAAALFTTLAALLFSHACGVAKTAGGILASVNAEFCSVFRGRSFMSACCAVIDREGRLCFAGAGHPPLVIRRRRGPADVFASLGTMVGIRKEMTVEESETTLDSGDVAVLYTDGLFSLKSKSGERFAPEAVAEACSKNSGTGETLQALIELLRQQSDGEPFEDDVAAIALRRV